MHNDIINFINEYPINIREKNDEIIISNIGKIIPNGLKDRFVIDVWKIHKDLAEETGLLG